MEELRSGVVEQLLGEMGGVMGMYGVKLTTCGGKGDVVNPEELLE